MAIQPHSRIESQLTDPTYNGPYLSRIELILKDMLENYGRIAFVGPYDSLEDLPETGQAGYVYLVRVEGSNLCDEYIWDEQEEEYNYVGRFEIDLADYQTKDLSNPITIDSVVYTTVEAALTAMNVSLSNVSRDALKKVSTMPQNPSNNDLVVWQGNNAYKVGHTYKYVEGTGETLYAWQVDNPGGIGDGTVIYTKSAIPDEDTNIYKSDGTAYSSSTDDPTYELMVGGESAITIEIFSLSQMQSWERSALRKSSDDIVATSGEWVEVTKDNIQDDWEQSDSSAPDYIKNKPTLGTAASRNATNQITEGSTALPEAGAVKTALDGKISTSNTPGHVMNDGTIDQTQYEKSGVAESLVKDTVGWTGKNQFDVDTCSLDSTQGIAISNHTIVFINNFYIAARQTIYLHEGEKITLSYHLQLTSGSAYVSCRLGENVIIYEYRPTATGDYSSTFTAPTTGTYYFIFSGATDDATGVFSNIQVELGSTATSYEPYHATVDTVKADKVTNATSGHLAGLDSNGNLTDSGVSPTEDVTVEGNPVTFDSPFEQDAKSVVVSVKPIQDLHGYDHPWPAGGGKNKLPLTVDGIKALNTDGTWSGNTYTYNGGIVTILTDGNGNVTALRLNGTFSAYWQFNITGWIDFSGTYILNGTPGVTGTNLYVNNDGQVYEDFGNGVNFTVAEQLVCRMVIDAATFTNVDVFPMIRLATESDASFAPYSNECPISGINELEIGVSDGESEPTTTTIPLPSTLYDADVDVTNGDANSRKEFVEFDGSADENWQMEGAPTAASGSKRFILLNVINYPTLPSSYYPLNVITNGLSLASGDATWGGSADNALSISLSGTDINIRVAGIDTVEGLKTWLLNNPVQLCYELATPTTLSFTPTDVELLEGTNVVSTNAEKVAVKYKAGILATLGDIDDLNDKVKTKFDKANVATIETGSTASKTYYKGDYIVRSDGCLYDVTATIASGAAFTNNNTHKTNLGDELNKFKVYVSTADSPVDGNDVASVSISGYLPISPFQVFSWSGSGTVSITPKSSGGTWNVSGDVSNVRYGQIFMRT